jgi:hypothetical protein
MAGYGVMAAEIRQLVEAAAHARPCRLSQAGWQSTLLAAHIRTKSSL